MTPVTYINRHWSMSFDDRFCLHTYNVTFHFAWMSRYWVKQIVRLDNYKELIDIRRLWLFNGVFVFVLCGTCIHFTHEYCSLFFSSELCCVDIKYITVEKLVEIVYFQEFWSCRNFNGLFTEFHIKRIFPSNLQIYIIRRNFWYRLKWHIVSACSQFEVKWQ